MKPEHPSLSPCLLTASQHALQGKARQPGLMRRSKSIYQEPIYMISLTNDQSADYFLNLSFTTVFFSFSFSF